MSTTPRRPEPAVPEPAVSAPVIVDARGHRCPTPTLRLRRALEAAPQGAEIVLLADDAMARIDVPHFAMSQGHDLVAIASEGQAYRFTVRKGGPRLAQG